MEVPEPRKGVTCKLDNRHLNELVKDAHLLSGFLAMSIFLETAFISEDSFLCERMNPFPIYTAGYEIRSSMSELE